MTAPYYVPPELTEILVKMYKEELPIDAVVLNQTNHEYTIQILTGRMEEAMYKGVFTSEQLDDINTRIRASDTPSEAINVVTTTIQELGMAGNWTQPE